MKRKMQLFIFAALATLTITACGNNDAAPAPAADPAPAAEPAPTEETGQALDPAVSEAAVAIYESNCMSCHATDLGGVGTFPSLQQTGARLTEEEIKNKINVGGNGMPAFQGILTDAEVETLAQWLAAKK